VAKALSPARVREVYLDDEAKEATIVTPDDQLALAIGKEGMNARLAARLTGWKIDIKSDTEFATEEADAAYAGEGDGEGEFTGRCSAVLSTGKRCPNAALPGSRYCGVPAHQELARLEAAGELPVQPEPVADEAEELVADETETPAEEPAAEEPVAAEEAAVEDVPAEEPVAAEEPAVAEEPEPVAEAEASPQPEPAAVEEDETAA